MRSISGFNSGSLDGSFASGESISASALNKLAGAVDKTRTMMSNDLQHMAGMGGVSYGTNQQVYYVSAGNPLDPSLSEDKVTIQPGTVNRYIPKIGNNYIDKVPAPTITVTANGHILVKVTYEANKYFPRTAEVVFVAGATPPVDTETISHYPLSTVTQTIAGGITTYALQNLSSGNLICNRLKSGQGMATWWWDVIK